MHLLIDGYGADPELLADQQLIAEFLDEFPSQIGMTKISSPQVHNYVGAVPEDWGVSGFVIIAESHISIHTFPEKAIQGLVPVRGRSEYCYGSQEMPWRRSFWST